MGDLPLWLALLASIGLGFAAGGLLVWVGGRLLGRRGRSRLRHLLSDEDDDEDERRRRRTR